MARSKFDDLDLGSGIWVLAVIVAGEIDRIGVESWEQWPPACNFTELFRGIHCVRSTDKIPDFTQHLNRSDVLFINYSIQHQMFDHL